VTATDRQRDAARSGDSEPPVPLLRADHLSVTYGSGDRALTVLRDASIELHAGSCFGLVGESGSGKSVLVQAILGITSWLGGRVTSGQILFEGVNVLDDPDAWRRLRGGRVGYVSQHPGRSFNPTRTIGAQIAEVYRAHHRVSRRQAWERAVEMLDRVGISDARRRARAYPHTFSGGMSQRAMIAMALVCGPSFLIADEPTTALDVTIQAKILDLLRELQRDERIAILFVSHDMAVVSEMCDRVAVVYAGRIVEQAPIDELFVAPKHPYTEALLGTLPSAVSDDRRRFVTVPGSVPSSSALPAGCEFHPRCRYATDGCRHGEILELITGPHRSARCARAEELVLKGLPVR
jgi:oligopeptide/dipeptide ABC transporter ATP-binding protein